MRRRTLLKAIGAAGAFAGAAGVGGKGGGAHAPHRRRAGSPTGAPATGAAAAGATMPAIFLAHGSPMLLDDHAWMGELQSWARCRGRRRC